MAFDDLTITSDYSDYDIFEGKFYMDENFHDLTTKFRKRKNL